MYIYIYEISYYIYIYIRIYNAYEWEDMGPTVNCSLTFFFPTIPSGIL